ncbi:MarR family transcriptional regulator [Natronococcus occultus]|uniref:Transcriptional regulator n=1 Tax=Natronococcus occultus SP4 TaxID=694430 RepID=L0K2C7_9EURY|nr:helix-turn-helix domain-containing protein [Natronococcus occultus]AGB38705.1 transcriptional regulator [Natronococcus occultus SP4]
MPVRFDEYDPNEHRLDLSEGTNANRILSFLVENPEYGFTPKEIHEATGVARGSVSPTLLRLQDHGLVRHKGDRWAAASEEKIAAYQSMYVSLEAISDRYSDDWYANTPDWDEEIEDLRERNE